MTEDQATRLIGGEAEGVGAAGSVFEAIDAAGRTMLCETTPLATQQDAMARICAVLRESAIPEPQAIGHRIVHGGPWLRDHCRIDAAVERTLASASAFAPLHMAAALSLIREAATRFPGLPQVACFDTTFHRHLPDVARTLPLPADLRAEGLQRYGFHGLSCESIVRQLAAEAGGLPRRLVIAHLGSGASLTAVHDGVSVDTSMGLTPSGGVVMGTRTGDLDPGVLVYLIREKRLDADRLEDLVDRRSGLLGVSGVSADLRVLHTASATNADADLALRLFCRSVQKELGAMSVVLDGLDTIVFTGGIGEHDAQMVAAICAGLSSLGVGVDAANRADGERPVDPARSRCRVRVLTSLEDAQIALHTAALTRSAGSAPAAQS